MALVPFFPERTHARTQAKRKAEAQEREFHEDNGVTLLLDLAARVACCGARLTAAEEALSQAVIRLRAVLAARRHSPTGRTSSDFPSPHPRD